MTIPNVTTDAQAFVSKAYDYVIIGGGTAGLALASRLSEDAGVTVGVLEAGSDRSEEQVLKSATGWPATVFGPDWSFSYELESEPITHGAGQKIKLPRGNMLGGCSTMNALMWTRAGKSEYDSWEELGATGWNFKSLVPYFNKAQGHTPLENPILPGTGKLSEYQGANGPIKTSYNTWYSSLAEPFRDSCKEIGFGVNSTIESGDIRGVVNLTRSVDHDTQTRQHSAVTYLKLTEGRKNISVLTGALVHKVHFAEGAGDLVATGVEFEVAGTKHTVKAKKEVILAAGAYGSPKVLELSGIGRKTVLDKFGIKQHLELPVGENLQDHLMLMLFFGLTPEALASLSVKPVNDSIKNEPGTDAASTTTAGPFLYTNFSKILSKEPFDELVSLLDSYIASPDSTPLEKAQFKIQRDWLVNPSSTATDAHVMFACFPGMGGFPLPDGTLTLGLPSAHVHPASRGTTHIRSTNPADASVLDHQFLSREYDVKALLQVARLAQKVTQQAPFSNIVAGGLAPPPNLQTDEELIEFVKANIVTFFHPVGSTAMASKELGGVVDPYMKVYGAKNLRVVGDSVIPLQIGCTPMATIYAMTEKIADEIKKGH